MKRALVALVVVLLGPSCAGGDDGHIEALTAAPDRVEEVGSFQMRLEAGVETLKSGGELRTLVRMDAAFDTAADRWTMTLPASGDDDSTNGQTACRLRADRDVAYVQVAGEGGDDARHWFRMTAKDSDDAGSDQFLSFVKDAEGLIGDLRQAGEGVEVVGSEEVSGVTTTHYRFTLSADDLEGRMGPLGIAPADADGPVDHDVWIDGDGLPRRMRVGVEGATSLRTELVLDLFDFGEPLEIEIPPDGEIEPTDERESILARCMEGAFGGRGSSSEPTPRPPSADASSTLFRVGRVADSIRDEHGTYEAVTAEELEERLIGDLEVVGDAVVAQPGIVSFRAVGPDEIRFALYTSDGVCTGLRNLADADPGERSNFTAVREVDEGCGPRLFSLEHFGAAP